ncbi:MAG: hypothetical protein E6I94_11600 [Chloroflexi bacterium]|nr:MAG: hypothetical protein E6I94_11600 [Chloroflexota bacterium]
MRKTPASASPWGARVRDCYDAERYARLVELKRRWDPKNAFHLNQNIAPAPAGGS